MDRVAETVKERRPFEKEVYNAGLAVRPDFFRKDPTDGSWISPKRFVVSTKGLPIHKISAMKSIETEQSRLMTALQ